MKGFSIIIVTWNALHHLKTFLPSVVNTDYPDFEIIIADNASTDGTAEWIQSTYPNVVLATFDKNYGYCGGNNRAVPYATKEVLLFLNNDVEVKANWLTAINLAFERDESVAAVQPKMLAYRQKDFFEYAGAAGGYLDKYGYPYCRGRVFDTVEQDTGQYNTSSEIFWASGAALAIRKEVFTELGGFDEDFEFHMEEIDLCWRIHRSGHTVMYTPDSTVYHLGGGSLAMGSPRKVYYNFRNNLFMLWKNMKRKDLVFRFPSRLILDIIAAWKSLLSGNGGDFLAIAKAHYHFLLGWTSVHKKRRHTNLPFRINTPGLSPFNLIWQYFVRGKKYFHQLPGHESDT